MDVLTAGVARAVKAAIDRQTTVSAAASQAGIPRVTLIRRLTGASPFTTRELEALANVLGAQPSEWIRQAERAS